MRKLVACSGVAHRDFPGLAGVARREAESHRLAEVAGVILVAKEGLGEAELGERRLFHDQSSMRAVGQTAWLCRYS